MADDSDVEFYSLRQHAALNRVLKKVPYVNHLRLFLFGLMNRDENVLVGDNPLIDCHTNSMSMKGVGMSGNQSHFVVRKYDLIVDVVQGLYSDEHLLWSLPAVVHVTVSLIDECENFPLKV